MPPLKNDASIAALRRYSETSSSTHRQFLAFVKAANGLEELVLGLMFAGVSSESPNEAHFDLCDRPFSLIYRYPGNMNFDRAEIGLYLEHDDHVEPQKEFSAYIDADGLIWVGSHEDSKWPQVSDVADEKGVQRLVAAWVEMAIGMKARG